MAGSMVETITRGQHLCKAVLVWTSHTDGTVAATTSFEVNGKILRVGFIPGTAGDQPDDNYDVTLSDDQSFDVLVSGGQNRSQTTPQWSCPVLSTYFPIVNVGKLTLAVAAAGSENKGTIVLIWESPGQPVLQ
jgi:hypothetical protein